MPMGRDRRDEGGAVTGRPVADGRQDDPRTFRDALVSEVGREASRIRTCASAGLGPPGHPAGRPEPAGGLGHRFSAAASGGRRLPGLGGFDLFGALVGGRKRDAHEFHQISGMLAAYPTIRCRHAPAVPQLQVMSEDGPLVPVGR